MLLDNDIVGLFLSGSHFILEQFGENYSLRVNLSADFSNWNRSLAAITHATYIETIQDYTWLQHHRLTLSFLA